MKVDAFSSLKGLGVDVLRNKLDEWFAPAFADLIDEDFDADVASDHDGE
ncbi:GTP-binding protein EngB [Vibrio ponticus]|nr:GTP-binding protein EngB [Vibrio ponticus]